MIKLTIPRTPHSQNHLYNLHWSKRRVVKQKWIDDIYWTARKNKAIPKKPYKKARVKITIYFSINRRRDTDNYPCKELIDGLRYAGIIEDDNIKVIGKPRILFGVDKENPRTEIEIEEIK